MKGIFKDSFSLSVHPSVLIPAVLLCYFNDLPTVLVMLTAFVLHELGHLSVALWQGRKIYALNLSLSGAQLCVQTEGFSYGRDVCLHLAGALCNLLTAIVCVFWIRLSPEPIRFFAFYFNALLAIFHLLPLEGLDGAHALYAFLCRKRLPYAADQTVQNASRLTKGVFGAVSLLLVFKIGFHLSLFATLFFALCGSFLQRQRKT